MYNFLLTILGGFFSSSFFPTYLGPVFLISVVPALISVFWRLIDV